MKKIITFYICLMACLMMQAQEQAFVHTDKDCYLAGEDMWVKMYVTDGDNKPTVLSKVGYVEICNTEHAHVQLKLALVDGSGWGRVRIPVSVPTGVYRLTGYTRYMRNGGEPVFFKKQIAIINTFRSTETDRFLIAEERPSLPASPAMGNMITATTGKPEYGNRSQVQLKLQGLPKDAGDITVSVFRDDTLTAVPSALSLGERGVPYAHKWIPEYEGHIMTGRLVGEEGKASSQEPLQTAGIAFVGKDFMFTYGKKTEDGIVFNTSGAYGPQEVVLSAVSVGGNPLRIDLQSPFSETLPKELPALQLYPDKEVLKERSVGVQLQQIMVLDSVGSYPVTEKFYNFTPALSYDLDQYTRFATVRETFIEFVGRIHLEKINGETVIQVLHIETKRYSTGKALVVLDGVPIYSHENMLSHNPYLIKRIDIYDGRYEFGGEIFDCMVSFVSHKARLSGLRLGDESQLVVYDCPHMQDEFDSPAYDRAESNGLRKPDFRHTLYWNPDVKPDANTGSADLTFYTSDLRGNFKIVVEAVTKDGKIITGGGSFCVK